MKAKSSSTASTLTPLPTFDHLNLFQTHWFPKLLILMFGLVLSVAAHILKEFSFLHWNDGVFDPVQGIATLEFHSYAMTVMARYFVVLGLDAAIASIFIAACLSKKLK